MNDLEHQFTAMSSELFVFNQVKSRNSTRLKLAIDDQHWIITIHNIITHARQIETCRA